MLQRPTPTAPCFPGRCHGAGTGVKCDFQGHLLYTCGVHQKGPGVTVGNDPLKLTPSVSGPSPDVTGPSVMSHSGWDPSQGGTLSALKGPSADVMGALLSERRTDGLSHLLGTDRWTTGPCAQGGERDHQAHVNGCGRTQLCLHRGPGPVLSGVGGFSPSSHTQVHCFRVISSGDSGKEQVSKKRARNRSPPS